MKHFVCLMLLLSSVESALAQQVGEPAPPESPLRAVTAEMVGGAVGSLAGVLIGGAAGVASENCDSRIDPDADMCGLGGALVGGFVGSIAGSAAGAVAAGYIVGDRPSIAGAIGGSVIGVLSGAALAYVTNAATGDEHEVPVLVSFSVGQGTLAGLGAWLWGQARRGAGSGAEAGDFPESACMQSPEGTQQFSEVQ